MYWMKTLPTTHFSWCCKYSLFIECRLLLMPVTLVFGGIWQFFYLQCKSMKSSFPKRVKRPFRKWHSNGNAKFYYYVLEKSFSHMNKGIYMYIFMKSSFPELAIGIAASILNWCLTHFGKELFICSLMLSSAATSSQLK